MSQGCGSVHSVSTVLGDNGALNRWGLIFERTQSFRHKEEKKVLRVAMGTKIIFLQLPAPGFMGH